MINYVKVNFNFDKYFEIFLILKIQEIIQILKKLPENRLTSDLNEISRIIEKHKYFEEQGITGKYLQDVSELLTYQFAE